MSWAVVVAQLAVWSLPTPEVCGSNPVLGIEHLPFLLTVICIEKTKKEKWPGMAHLKTKVWETNGEIKEVEES